MVRIFSSINSIRSRGAVPLPEKMPANPLNLFDAERAILRGIEVTHYGELQDQAILLAGAAGAGTWPLLEEADFWLEPIRPCLLFTGNGYKKAIEPEDPPPAGR